MIIPIDQFANAPDNNTNENDNLLVSGDLFYVEDITTSISYGGTPASRKKKINKKTSTKKTTPKKTNWRK